MAPREKILTDAIEVTSTSRETAYGPPSVNLKACAALWEAYLTSKYPATFTITAEDVAWLNVLQKIARTFNGSYTEDTYIDAAAYAAIAGECKIIEKQTKEAILSDNDLISELPMKPQYDPKYKVEFK